MPFGILEDHKLSDVPGTGPLSTKANQATVDQAGELKRGTGKYSHIVLLPQPSDDPSDPLNWPRWKKEACFWTLTFTSGMSVALPIFVTAVYVLLARDFHVSVDEVVSSFASYFVGGAIWIFVQNPLTVKYGHRMIFLLSTFLMFMSCVWTALSTGLVSVSASRALQGVATAPIQGLAVVTIEHLYFIHERSSRTCVWVVFTTLAPMLGVTINSYVTQKLSWQLGFWLASIACGLSFVGVLFFMPETTYRRQPPPSHDSTMIKCDNTTEKGTFKKTPPPSGDDVRPRKLRTFLSQVKIYNGTFSDESIWKLSLRPFPFILSPVTWFYFISVSMPLVLQNFADLCIATIFTITYRFDATETGLTQLGAIVSFILCLIVAGPFSDRWIVWMSQRNRGIYEPEFRLIFTQSMLVGVFGYIGWAIGYDHQMPWIGAVACLVMIYFSVIASATTINAYLIDTHGSNAFHLLSLNHFITSMISYGTTFFANGLVLSAGIKHTLFVLGALQAACWLSWIPMYVFGKRVRSFIARHPRLFSRDLLEVRNSESLPSVPSLRRGPESESGSKGEASGGDGGVERPVLRA